MSLADRYRPEAVGPSSNVSGLRPTSAHALSGMQMPTPQQVLTPQMEPNGQSSLVVHSAAGGHARF
jgi:hypothetical protein